MNEFCAVNNYIGSYTNNFITLPNNIITDCRNNKFLLKKLNQLGLRKQNSAYRT